jgi:senataxin
MLREQYRMHPAISAWPSRWFYSGLLSDGAGVDAASRGAPFHAGRGGARGPFVVWDCAGGRERGGGGGGGSLRNDAEVRLAIALIAGACRAAARARVCVRLSLILGGAGSRMATRPAACLIDKQAQRLK